MINKKSIVCFELGLLIISVFAFSYLISQSSFFAEEDFSSENFLTGFLLKFFNRIKTPVFGIVSASGVEQLGCCSVNSEGEKCATSFIEDCKGEFAQGALCEATSFCVKGCCYDENKGIYDKNVLKTDCPKEWNSDPNCNLPGARMGCCVLGGVTRFLTEGQCKIEISWRGVDLDWRSDLNELQCILI